MSNANSSSVLMAFKKDLQKGPSRLEKIGSGSEGNA
jgi:hypothetical protein